MSASGISAETLWNQLFSDDEGWLVSFTGKQSEGGRAYELTAIRQSYFRYPSEAPKAADRLRAESRSGRDAYFGVHLFRESGTRRRTDAMPTVRTLWLDEDEGRYPDEGPQPGIIVCSSAKRRHLYWPLTESVTTEVAISLNRRIALWSGGDVGKAALSTVLRVPETCNYKRLPKVDPVRGFVTDSGVWKPEILDSLLPPLPREPQRKKQLYTGLPGEKLNLREFLCAAGVTVTGEIADTSAERVYRIVCPWLHEHSRGDRSGTRVGQYPDGATFFHCEHEHCHGRDWTEFREEVDPRPPSRGGKVYARRRGVVRVG